MLDSEEVAVAKTAQRKLGRLVNILTTLEDPNFGIPSTITPTQEQLAAAEAALQTERTQIHQELAAALQTVLGG